MQLQVAGFLDNSLVNGKGIRSVLFVSGCRHNCNGCHNKEMQSYEYGDKVDIKDIYERIVSNIPLIKGVTFSGGEPFDKAVELTVLAKMLKEKGLNIWCYTGYNLEDIMKNKKNTQWKELLKNIDILVDGKFDEENINSICKYIGSANQRIIDVPKTLIEDSIVIKEIK